MPTQLTKDAEKLLVAMYKRYVESKKDGRSRAIAKHMGGSDQIRAACAPGLSQDDVDELCRELSRAKYLEAAFADDTIYDAYLKDSAIIDMENRIKDSLLSAADFISKFIP